MAIDTSKESIKRSIEVAASYADSGRLGEMICALAAERDDLKENNVLLNNMICRCNELNNGLCGKNQALRTERDTLQADNAKLREDKQLHAGDVASLSNELDEWKGRAQESEAEVAKLRAEVEGLREGEKDTQRLDALASEYWDLRSFEIPTGAGDADVGWRVMSFHQSKPHERIIAEVYHDDPRAAIDAAITSTGGDHE